MICCASIDFYVNRITYKCIKVDKNMFTIYFNFYVFIFTSTHYNKHVQKIENKIYRYRLSITFKIKSQQAASLALISTYSVHLTFTNTTSFSLHSFPTPTDYSWSLRMPSSISSKPEPKIKQTITCPNEGPVWYESTIWNGIDKQF